MFDLHNIVRKLDCAMQKGFEVGWLRDGLRENRSKKFFFALIFFDLTIIKTVPIESIAHCDTT